MLLFSWMYQCLYSMQLLSDVACSLDSTVQEAACHASKQECQEISCSSAESQKVAFTSYVAHEKLTLPGLQELRLGNIYCMHIVV